MICALAFSEMFFFLDVLDTEKAESGHLETEVSARRDATETQRQQNYLLKKRDPTQREPVIPNLWNRALVQQGQGKCTGRAASEDGTPPADPRITRVLWPGRVDGLESSAVQDVKGRQVQVSHADVSGHASSSLPAHLSSGHLQRTPTAPQNPRLGARGKQLNARPTTPVLECTTRLCSVTLRVRPHNFSSYAHSRPPTRQKMSAERMEDTFPLASMLHRIQFCNS